MRLATSVLLALAFCAIATSGAARAVAIGEAAPSLRAPDAAGEIVDLAKLRGKVVYVDFWASWCGPCKRSFPWMNAMLEKYRAQGLEVVAVNVDRKRADAERFLATTPAQFTIAYDASGAMPSAWQVKAMPTSFLVDAQGRVAFIESGFRDERKDDVEARIRAALPNGGAK